jgi:hypothetical protein
MADGGTHFSGPGKRVKKDVVDVKVELGNEQHHKFTNKKKEALKKDEKSK